MRAGFKKGAFIVRYLLERRGEIVSGEELALHLGISRVALNKHIRRLISLGVPIVSVERKGYLLEEEPDLIVPEVIGAYVGDDTIFCRFYTYPVIDSTNRMAKDLAYRGEPEGTVVVADHQTSGKGRQGRRWYSPPGKNLYFSLLLRPSISAMFMYHITMLASVAVCESLRELGVEALIKWPNDVYASGRKICGILTEAEMREKEVLFMVVGIGLNVNMRRDEMPPYIREIATSVAEETGAIHNRSKLLGDILIRFDRWYRKLQGGDTRELFVAWRQHNYTLGRRVVVDDDFEGEVVGITPTGELLVRDDEGNIRSVVAGDLRVIQ